MGLFGGSLRVKKANHAVGVVVGGLVGLELVHARVAFLAHFACGEVLPLVIMFGFDVLKMSPGYSSQKKDIRAALALSVSACGKVLPCCDGIRNTVLDAVRLFLLGPCCVDDVLYVTVRS